MAAKPYHCSNQEPEQVNSSRSTACAIRPSCRGRAPPTGSGQALQLVDPSRDNSRPSNWSAAQPDAGEPGMLLPMTANWRYNQNGFVPTGWNQPEFNDAAWPSGDALLFVETAALPAPKNTPLSLGPITYYFRTSFDYSGTAGGGTLALSTIIDDGAVIYLNGSELLRLRLPDGQITANTLATPFVDNAELRGKPLVIPAPTLLDRPEYNRSRGSSQSVSQTARDIWSWGSRLPKQDLGGDRRHPRRGKRRSDRVHPEIAQLALNEIRPIEPGWGKRQLRASPSHGSSCSARAGRHDARWLVPQRRSGGAHQVAVSSGSELGGSEFQLRLARWGDRETTGNDWPCQFEPAATSGSILLSYERRGRPGACSSMPSTYPVPLSGRSAGRLPDRQPDPASAFAIPTPSAPNDNSIPLPPVTINEWMASATKASMARIGPMSRFRRAGSSSTILVGSETVDLSASLSPTTSAHRDRSSPFPAGTVHRRVSRYLLVWADGEPGKD